MEERELDRDPLAAAGLVLCHADPRDAASGIVISAMLPIASAWGRCAPVWTIPQASLNKRASPLSIKQVTSAVVKTAWQ